jgi:hypothetical protein
MVLGCRCIITVSRGGQKYGGDENANKMHSVAKGSLTLNVMPASGHKPT